VRQSRNKLNVFNLFRHCRKDEISFDIVAKNGDNVAKNTMLPVSATMSPFLATLSLMWTGLKLTIITTVDVQWRNFSHSKVCENVRRGSTVIVEDVRIIPI